MGEAKLSGKQNANCHYKMIIYSAVWSCNAGIFTSLVHSDSWKMLWHLTRNKFVGEEEEEGKGAEVCGQQLG